MQLTAQQMSDGASATTPDVQSRLDEVMGELTGLAVPAHVDALQRGGAAWLTAAFQAFGSIGPATRVARITRLEPCPGGSTGQKFFLSVDYEPAGAVLHTDLFVKFSRDFSDALRDRGRHEMAAEIRLAALSRSAEFPVAVPTAYFADYDGSTGTGVLITERIAFGSGDIEPHRQKCLDHELPDASAHYRAIVTALARLAAAHKSGRLGEAVERWFPFDAGQAAASDRIPYDEPALRDKIARYADFCRQYPQLLPPHLRTAAFIARFGREAVLLLANERRIKQSLQSEPDHIALCHWNANIDNAWFRRNAEGELECGLMDWGRAGQMNVVYALWGCLSGAERDLWDSQLDALLTLFIDELARGGGPRLATAALQRDLRFYVAMMGLAWLLVAPERILYRLPEAATASGPRDPVFRRSESARNQLHIFTNFLNLWHGSDFGALLKTL